MQTIGISPKVPAGAFGTIIGFLAAKFGLDMPADVSTAIGVVVGYIFGLLAPAGTVVNTQEITEGVIPSDKLLSENVQKRLLG